MTAAEWMAAAQAEVCAALADRPCFVRRDTSDEALFASDWSRRSGADELPPALDALGFRCRLERGLLRVDASPARYAALLAALPESIPPLPADERLHPAYALCRLWLRAAPAPLCDQPLAPLRRALKRLSQPSELLQDVPHLHEQSAVWLRTHQPLPRAAGLVLADWFAHLPQ